MAVGIGVTIANMTIIEQHIVGKNGPKRCEDGIVATPNFVAVIDGSTSKSSFPPLPDGRSGGQMARDIVSEVIQTMPAETDVNGFVERVNASFERHYHAAYGTDICERMIIHKEDRWTCSVAIYSPYEHAIWMIGDCLATLFPNPSSGRGELVYTNDKPYEAVLAAKRAAITEQLLRDGVSVAQLRNHDTARDQIIPEMKTEMVHQNVTYSVLDGYPVAWNAVRIIALSPLEKGGGELVLASDGYPRIFRTLAETEAYLQQVLQDDPLMIRRHLATKAWMNDTASFDDRCYIRFRL